MQFTLAGRFYPGMKEGDFWGDDNNINITITTKKHPELIPTVHYYLDGTERDGWVNAYVHELNESVSREILAMLSGCKPHEIQFVEAGLM